MQKVAEMNVVKPAIAAAVVVIVAGVGMLLPPPSASAPAQPGSSPTAARVYCLGFGRRKANGDGERNSVLVHGAAVGRLGKHTALCPAGPPEGRCRSTGPSWAHRAQRRSSTGRAFPRRPRRSVCSCAEPTGRSIGGRLAPQCRGARHQARQGAFGRQRGRAPSEARRAHRSQEGRLRPRVLLHLATVRRGAFWRTTDMGDTIRIWIVVVDGERLFIAAATKAGG